MSFKEKAKEVIKEKLEKSTISPLLILDRHGLDENVSLDPETEEFYKDGEVKKSKWACPRCGNKTIFEKEDGRFHCECGGIFDNNLVVGGNHV